jgi:repressor LexA
MLTARQKAILDYIVDFRRKNGCSPSIPELQKAFGIRSPNGIAGHLLALESKGLIRRARRGSRQIDVTGPLHALKRESFDIPVYDRPPAGAAGPDAADQPRECLTIDEGTLGFRPSEACYALKVRGDGWIPDGLLDGDTVVLEPCAEPRSSRLVVAAPEGNAVWRTRRVRGKWFLDGGDGERHVLYPWPDGGGAAAIRTVVRRLK